MVFKRNVLALALASVGFCAASISYAAPQAKDGNDQATQTTAANDVSTAKAKAQAKEDQHVKNMSTITVTGFSRSIETSIDVKRYADTVVDVVTACEMSVTDSPVTSMVSETAVSERFTSTCLTCAAESFSARVWVSNPSIEYFRV